MREKTVLPLQLFAEGAAGSGAGSAEGSGAAADAAGVTTAPQDGRENGNDAGSEGSNPTHVSSDMGEDKATKFRELVKGEYAEEYNKAVQKIIDKRFGETKQLEEDRKAVKPILDMLSQKYGVDKADLKALVAAVQEDDAYYEEEALERGLSVKQLKEVKKLERENAELKEMREKAEMQHQADQFHAKWQQESEALIAKYGLQDFDYMKEAAENEAFRDLLATGNVSMEAAYLATHMDEMIGGAMARTAEAVRSDIAKNMTARNNRPAEGALNSKGTVKFGKDVNLLTKEERRALEARARRGELITPDMF